MISNLKKWRSGLMLLILCAPFFTSCGDDNNGLDISNAATLNMLNEGNGKTFFPNTNIYIDNANNFIGGDAYFVDLGTVSLNTNQPLNLEQLSNNVAVVQGHTYRAFIGDAVRDFPSGKTAAKVNANYCQLRVQQNIVKEGDVIGATIQYVVLKPESYGLPMPDTFIGRLDYSGQTLEYAVPKGAEAVYIPGSDDKPDDISVAVSGSRLIVTLNKDADQEYGPFGLRLIAVRVGTTFTTVNVGVGYKE